MKIEITHVGNQAIAEIISDNIVMNNTDDALDILGNCRYQGADHIILHEKNIIPAFFDLKTAIAGDILQKFSTYRVKLAIVGNFSKYASQSLKDFIYESNKIGSINFVDTVAAATEKLVKQGGRG